ncbi:MAG: ABC transporter ATP-binding protein [Pirellulales bacterium]
MSTAVGVADVSLRVDEGELLVVVGPSGSGKTTLLRLLAGLETPTAGQIWFDEREVTREASWRREVAMVADSAALLPHLTVAENLVWSQHNRRRWSGTHSTEQRVEQKEGWIERLGLQRLLNRYPPALSAGQQQRVALGRALLASPRVMLLDEPLGRLDASLRYELARCLRQLQRESGQSWVYVTHDRQEALLVADRIAVLDQGRLLQVGTPQELQDHPRHARVANWSWAQGGTKLRVRAESNGGEGSRKEVDSESASPVGKPSLANGRAAGGEAWWRPEDVWVERLSPAATDAGKWQWLTGCVESVLECGGGSTWVWVRLDGEQQSSFDFAPSTVVGVGRGVARNQDERERSRRVLGNADLEHADPWQPGETVRVGFDWDRASWFDSVSGWLLTVEEEANA